MHRLSLLHPSSPPFLFHVSQAWIPRDCLVTFSPVSVSPFRSLPREWRPPIQIRGRAALISRLKEFGLPSPRLPPVFSPPPPRFVNFFLPRGRKIAGTDFDQPFLKASAPRVWFQRSTFDGYFFFFFLDIIIIISQDFGKRSLRWFSKILFHNFQSIISRNIFFLLLYKYKLNFYLYSRRRIDRIISYNYIFIGKFVQVNRIKHTFKKKKKMWRIVLILVHRQRASEFS